MASICSGMETSADDAQTAPAKTQHDHGDCCAFCGVGHGGAIALEQPPLVFRKFCSGNTSACPGWKPQTPVPTVRVGSNAQARAPPQAT